MKKLIVASMMAALFAPMASRAGEDRLNLWPIVGYDDGALDVIWPLGHFKDSDEWRVFPIIRNRDMFCVFPEFWFMDSGFVVFPLAAEYDFSEGTLFPIVWWKLDGSGVTHSVFPAYYYHGRDYATTFWAACGLAGYNRYKTEMSHWLLPLYVKSSRNFYSIPYSHVREGDATSSYFLAGMGGLTWAEDGAVTENWLFPLWHKDRWSFTTLPYHCKWNNEGDITSWLSILALSGGWQEGSWQKDRYLLWLAGRNRNEADGSRESWCMPFYFGDNDGTFITPLYGRNKSSQWCFPLWYGDERSLYSALWCHTKDSDGSLKSWTVPLLLSGGRTKSDGSREADVLIGLGGATWGGKEGARSSWVFPFYYENSDGAFVTPLFGKGRESTWMLPLFYADRKSFVSLPYAHDRNEIEKTDTYIIPPLLSGFTRHDNGRTDVSTLLLYGHSTSGSGETRYNYLFPLYYYNGENGNFTSILYGSRNRGAYTSRWLATPIAGIRTGSKTGGWLFPFFNREKDASFDADLARLDAPTLSEDITFRSEVTSSTNSAGNVSCCTNTYASVRVDSRISGSVLLGSDHDQSVHGYLGGNEYRLSYNSKQGNRLFFNNETTRRVTYDVPTRRRVNEENKTESMLLCGLFYREHESDVRAATSHTHTRVLWKLWDREETNGDVTIDAFPGFTYDSKTNGYSKTSFLWRFFRYENDPEEGKKVDLLFIPMWR